MNRDITGVYFRIERDGKWCSIDFTDMTTKEKIDIIGDKGSKWLSYLLDILVQSLLEFEVMTGTNMINDDISEEMYDIRKNIESDPEDIVNRDRLVVVIMTLSNLITVMAEKYDISMKYDSEE